MTGRPPGGVVCLSPLAWRGQWTSRHEIAAELARRGRPVLFVEPPRNLLRRPTPLPHRAVPEGISLTAPPPYLPYGVLHLVPALAEASIRWSARRYADHIAEASSVAGLDGPGVLVLNSFMPVLGHQVAARLPDARHLYHRTDELRSFPTHHPLHERFEADVVRTADAVACSTPAIAEPMRRLRPDVSVVRNGVDVSRFAGAAAAPDLTRLRGPVAVVVGRIDHRTDPRVLDDLAAATTLVVAGPVARGHQLPERAVALGVVAPEAIPSVLAAADVAVVPYAGFAGDPLKVYEYLAAGLPTVVVAGPWLEGSPVAGAVEVVASTAELATGAVRAATERTPAGDRLRRAVAAEQSWSQRVDELLALVGEPAGAVPR